MKLPIVVFQLFFIHLGWYFSNRVSSNEIKCERQYQIWRIQAPEETIRDVSCSGKVFKMWGSGTNRTNQYVLVKSTKANRAKEMLKRRSLKYEVIVNDLKKALRKENPRKVKMRMDGRKLTWKAYHRFDDISEFLDNLAESSELCSVQTIGFSVENRPIKLLKVSNGNPGNKAIWVDGGIHGREWVSPASVTFLIHCLVKHFQEEDAAMQNLDWYFVPVLNPDGYEYTHSHPSARFWRKNRRPFDGCFGVDINRNFGYKWGGKGVSTDPCADNFGGREPFSEPESQAVRDFILKSTDIQWKAYLSLHSYGQFILFPWGYDKVDAPNEDQLSKLAEKMKLAIHSYTGTEYTFGSAAKHLYPAAGGSDDWALAEANFTYSFTIELRGTMDDGYLFMLPAKFIIPTATELIRAIRVLAEAAVRA